MSGAVAFAAAIGVAVGLAAFSFSIHSSPVSALEVTKLSQRSVVPVSTQQRSSKAILLPGQRSLPTLFAPPAAVDEVQLEVQGAPQLLGHAPVLGLVTAIIAMGGWLLYSMRLRSNFFQPLLPSQTAGQYAMMTYAGQFQEVTTASLCDELLSAAERSDRGQISSSVDNTKVKDLIRRLELSMIGQRTTTAQLDGEWELVWASDDVTRSSPFFWAFRQAFPDTSDQIFSITDGIPPQLKSIGQATQTITGCEGPNDGTLVSRVQVKALPTSPIPLSSVVMTTSSIVSRTSTKLTLRVQDTRVRDATLPFWDSAPPFPSGQALDAVKKGSSEVVMSTVYLDERIRISRNDADGSTFVWKRM